MNLDAWQTVWACVALSLVVLLLDAWLAYRAGPDKTELARLQQRSTRNDRISKEPVQ
jgi:hypothetical protein